MAQSDSRPPPQRLLDLLTLVGQVRSDSDTRKLTAFLGLPAESGQGAFMVVGQAPFGWVGGWTPSELRDSDTRQVVVSQAVEKSRELAGGVAQRNSRSRFWKVAREVAGAVAGVETERTDWANAINYSNLFRVAPAEGKTRNPTKGLRLLQQPLCVKMLAHEILLWRPSGILFLTGLSWAAPFVTAWEGTHLDLTGDEEIGATAKLSVRGRYDIPVVIADHPRSKSPALYASRISGLFPAFAA